MTCAQTDRVGGTGDVEVVHLSFLYGKSIAECIDFLLRLVLQFVDLDANLLLLVGWHIAEVGHEGWNDTFFAQVFDAKLFDFLSRIGCESFNLLE